MAGPKALKPIDLAKKMYRSMEKGANFSVELALEFDIEGETGTEKKFEQGRDQAGEDIGLSARFGKELDYE
ncbi:unnamed protein product [marine sediment metagenome]|uniref:Uncharacterized protein n=1 Tax=marine sediment metagenome TaxID=412755 RepID=X1PD49_9ZZZZ